jgi:hypothetical protein
MGGGASSLTRLRKAIVIRAYNLRTADETVDDQFRRFAQRGGDNVLYISLEDIRRSLKMETKEYEWVDHLFQHQFGAQVGHLVSYATMLRRLKTVYFLCMTGCDDKIRRLYKVSRERKAGTLSIHIWKCADLLTLILHCGAAYRRCAGRGASGGEAASQGCVCR